MDARKRKLAGGTKPERNVRAKATKYIQDDDSDEYDNEIGFKSSSRRIQPVSESEEEEEEEEEVSEDDDEDDEEEDNASPEPAPPSPVQDLTFGQILRKQEKQKQKKDGKDGKADKGGKAGSKEAAAADDKFATRDDRAGRPSEGKKPRPPARAHKHAPTEMSSRFAVKRGRDWTSGDATIAGVTVKSAAERSRDPRFFLASMATQPPSREDELRAQRNYAFLDEYRDAEMAKLREQMKAAERTAKAERKRFNLQRRHNHVNDDDEEAPTNTAKGEEAEREAAQLKQTLMSMEARKRDREAKAKAQAVLDEHRKRERDLVKQGKTPYFLKKSEQRKRLLVDQFAGMSDQQVDKAIEKRRKKAAMREKKEMPSFRR